MTNPTQDSLDHVARRNGHQDWREVKIRWPGNSAERTAMELHAIDRDQWLADKAELEAEIAALKKRPFCETCGKDVTEVLCSTCAKWWNDNPPPVDWQDNMDFEPSDGAVKKAREWWGSNGLTTVLARLIDHLEGRAPVKVDRATDEARKLIEPIWQNGTPSRDDVIAAVAGKLKELTNG